MADLKIKIKGDSKGLDSATNKAKGSLKGLKSSLASFAAGPAGMAIGAVTVAIGAMAGIAKATFNVLDSLAGKLDDVAKSAKRAGIGAEEFQFLSFAARRSGSDMATVEKSMKKMVKTITDAGRGLTTYTKILEALGVEFKDLQLLTVGEQFALLAQRLNLVESETTKAAISQELFGRGGTAIKEMVKDLDTLKGEWKDLNSVIGKDALDASESYEDSLENLTTQMKALGANSGALSALAELFAKFDQSTRNIRNNLDSISDSKFQKLASQLSKGNVPGLLAELVTDDRPADTTISSKEVKDLVKARREVREGIKNFLPTDGATGGNLPNQLQALSGDEMLKVGGLLQPLSNIATSPELSELQKQTKSLDEIVQRYRILDTNPDFPISDYENIFEDGS